MNVHRHFFGCSLILLLLGGCQTTQPSLMLSKKSAVELRAMQSRRFDTGDVKKVYRSVIATFQDLGYSITKVEPAAGVVSANKMAQLKMTATVFRRGENRVIVRSNAIVKVAPSATIGHQVDLPAFYQQRFFEPLSKSLFLTALQVEDPPDAVEKAAMKASAEIEKAASQPAKDAKAGESKENDKKTGDDGENSKTDQTQ